MDRAWERSFARYQPGDDEINAVLAAASLPARIRILWVEPIAIGCRNSNYHITTNQGDYLLRASPEQDAHYMNELVAFRALAETIAMPKLLAHLPIGDRMFLLYEYILSVSLADLQAQQGLDVAILTQIAKASALIHNVKEEDVAGLHRESIPPFSLWFDYFLGNRNIVGRLGEELAERVRQLVKAQGEAWELIDAQRSFIHNDYRPANMILTAERVVYIVDWEGSALGHTLADIGEFFRYRQCYRESDYALFHRVYHQHAEKPLPENWVDLSRLYDLANCLQMMGTDQELPNKMQDLREVVAATVAYFDGEGR